MPVRFLDEKPKVRFLDEPKSSVRFIDEDKGASIGGVGKQFAIGAGNEALLGFPLFLQEKFQGEQAVRNQESQEPIERFARGVGTATGFVAGLPKVAIKGGIGAAKLAGKAFLGTDKAKKVNRFIKGAGEGAAAFGALEAVSAPEEDFKEKLVTVPISAIFGGAIGVAGEALAPFAKKAIQKLGFTKQGRATGTKELDDLNKLIDAGKRTEEANVKLKIKDIQGTLKTEFVDRQAAIRTVEEQVLEATGRTLPFKDLPSTKAALFLGHQGKILDNTIKYKEIVGGNSRYIDAIEQVKLAEGLLERAQQGLKNPRGFDTAKANKVLTDIKAKFGDKLFNQFRQVTDTHRRGLFDNLLREAEEAGFLTKGKAQELINKNQQYTPFTVLEFLENNASNIARGKNGFNVSKPGALKLRKGTEKDILNPIDAEIRYMTKMTSAIERNKVKLSILDDLRNLGKESSKFIKTDVNNIPEGFSKVNVFKNGIKEEFAVPTHLADTISGLNSKTVDLMTRMAGSASRALRAGATTFNISFAVPNVIRDVVLAKTAVASKHGVNFKILSDFTGGVAEALRKGPIYRQWLREGGSFSGLIQNLRRTTPELKGELFPSISRRALNATNPFKMLAHITETSETATRLGVFRASLRAGKSVEEAAFISRRASIDFARSGNTMQILNMWVPFLNARLQGTLTAIGSAKANPRQFTMTAASLLGAPFVLTYANNVTQYPDVWQQVRSFEKEKNFLFIYGRNKDEEGKFTDIIKIPKGDIGELLINPLEAFFEFALGRDPEFSKLLLRTASNISPISFERNGEFSGSAISSSILPPPVKGLVETVTNKNLFTDRDIVPRSLQKASPGQQFKESTPPIAIQVGKILNISPLKIENLAGTLFGGVGRQVIDPFNAPGSLGRRFKGAFAGEDEQRQFDILEDIIRDTEDSRAEDVRFARQALVDFRALPPVPAIKQGFIQRRFKDNPDALKRFVDLVSAESRGDKAIFRTLRSSRVRDRIKFLREYSKTLETDEEKILFLKELLQNKVLTPQSFQRLK